MSWRPGLRWSALQVRPDAVAQSAGGSAFRYRLAAWTPGAALHLHCDGVTLLGAERLPVNFDLDGRTSATGQRISGWVRLGWRPESPPPLRFEDEAGRRHEAAPGSTALSGLRWPFRIDARRAGLRGERITISARLPDGRWQPLPDSPLLLDAAARRVSVAAPVPARAARGGRSGRTARTDRPVWCDVIIPVYRGRRETLACIDSVLATAGRHTRVIVVDDATDDAALAAALDALAAAGSITLLRNEANQGFVRSVNRALALHPADDAVLLNSDTQVYGNWLARLRAAAYSAPKVGTVTPFTNSGSIASYPLVEGQPMSAEEAGRLDALAAKVHAGVRAPIPVGVGFCLYVRRDCLDEVGGLRCRGLRPRLRRRSGFLPARAPARLVASSCRRRLRPSRGRSFLRTRARGAPRSQPAAAGAAPPGFPARRSGVPEARPAAAAPATAR